MDWKKNPVAVLAVLSVIHLLAHIDRNMVMGFSPQITRDLDLSNTQYGFLVGAVWVLSFGVMAMFMGTLADRYARPRVIAAGIAIWSACTWASGQATSFEQMILARFFVASGEAALVPAAVSLLIELFAEKRRASVVGVFFLGIPLGIGISFLLTGTVGATLGWRGTFSWLGIVGVAIALPLSLLSEARGQKDPPARGEPFVRQIGAVWTALRTTPALGQVIFGFVLIHVAFAGLAFVQLWLVRERGLDAADIATRIGGLQLLFGAIGSLSGGVLADRLAGRFRGGHAGFVVLMIVLCTPLMMSCRFTPAGSGIFYTGLCAGFFLPLAVYSPSLCLIQNLVPDNMRSTITGVTMMCINVVAIALGNLTVGWTTDHLLAAGSPHAYTWVLLGTDLVVASAALMYGLASRSRAP